jgi:hypothetical protein
VIQTLDTSITPNTRSNKYAEIIMDPNLNFEERWQGFVNFANRKGSKLGKELQITIDSFKNILTIAERESITDNDRWYILSTVVQLMKKAHNTNS